jgi:transposase
MRAYSSDLRVRIVAAVEGGMSHPEAARTFSVGERTVRRYLHQWRTTGTLTAKPIPGRLPAIAPAAYPAVVAQLAAASDATLAEHCDCWEEATGVRVSTSTWCRVRQRVDWTHKKAR